VLLLGGEQRVAFCAWVLLMQHNSSTARQSTVELLIDMPAVKEIELELDMMMSVAVLATWAACTGRYRT
jgi:hypothetical protein